MSHTTTTAAAATTPFVATMGPHTYQVSVRDVFHANRQKLMRALTTAAAANSHRHNHHERPAGAFVVVYLQGGRSETRFDSDHELIFRQESYFWWLVGVKEPDCGLSICGDPTTTVTTLYVPRLPADYATIMGKIRSLSEWQELYQVDKVKYTDEIEDSLLQDLEELSHGVTAAVIDEASPVANGNQQCSNSPPKLLLMRGPNSDSGKMYEPPSIANPRLAEYIDTATLFPVLAECRVIKSEAELSLLRHVTEITSFAHAYVMRNFKVGMMEYQAESLFRHYCYYNYGARLVGYTPICGCGPDAAILHYGHAGEPNSRQASPNDLCLFDMGAEYGGYGSDVTCSFPASGSFTAPQFIVHQAVYRAQVAVYNMMKPGVSWTDCHKAAEAEILRTLIAADLVILPPYRTVAELVELRLGAVFQPHGLGHFLGIDTHDVGGYLPGHDRRSALPGLDKLRTARVLQANMVLTVEPGCYFIDHLLDEAMASAELRPYLNVEKINNEYRGSGGVRLEDVVQVTDTGIINYTLCPRTVNEIESVMAGGKWPPVKDEAPELRRVRLTDPTPLPAPPSL